LKSTVAADWHPGQTPSQPNDFRTHQSSAPAQGLPALQAPPGVTAIAGQALQLNGEPLPGVTFQVGKVTARTDATGRFLLTNVPGGRQVMEIDGTTASSADATFGTFDVGLNVVRGRTSILPFPVWMTRLDTQHAITISSPTRSEVVLTNPDIPGLEVHLPAGTVVKDRNGRPVTKLSLTAIPVDKPPFPLPIAVDVPIYFTVQPGGAYLYGQGARIVYPNFTHLLPGTRVDFWDYDAAKKGWFVYGKGTVTPNGKQVVPDPGVVVWSFSGAMINGSGFTKWLAGWLHSALGIDADPVDLGTGFFAYQKTDLLLPDTLPLDLTRTHLQGDTTNRSFGVGTTFSLDINLFSENQYQEVDLYVPGNAKIHYVRTSPGTGFNDAVFQTTNSPDQFYKSTIAWNGNGWDLRLKSGTVLVFGENAPLQSIRDRNGNQITLIRDNGRLGNIVQAVTTNGRWLGFTRDTSNRIVKAQDNLGRTVTYDYDGSGRLFHVIDPQGGVTTYQYDAANNIATVTDPRSNALVTNSYDGNGRVTMQTLADHSNYKFTYVTDASNHVTETDVTDPRGFVRRVTFDAAGQLLADTVASGQPEQLTVTLTRDPATEFVTAVTDPANRKTTLGYDGLGNLTSLTRMAGTAEAQTITMTYESKYSRVTSVTDALLHPTSLTYDGHGNLTQVSDALGHLTTISPRLDGRPASMTDAQQHVTTYTYDLGDLTSITDPLGRKATTLTDGVGRPMASVDALGNRLLTHHDAMNQVSTVTDPIGATTTFAYDPNGNLLSVSDANQHPTSYAYDSRDRLVSRLDALQRKVQYSYDAGGNLTTIQDSKGQTTALGYDGLGRRTFTGFNAVTSGGTVTYDSTVGYTYDSVSRLTKVADSAAGSIQLSYDDYDRLTQVTSPQGTIGYGYDAADRMTARTIGTATLSYGYDAANRLLSISQAGTTLVSKTYDDANRLTSLSLPGGIVETPAYDAASQLTGITYAAGSTALGDVSYSYDPSGNRSTVGGSWARTGLPQPVGSASYDAANQLTTWNGTPITYDANGNLTGDGTSTYSWDSRGQLSEITGAVSASFAYDGLGRRAQKTVGGVTTGFLYDGTNPVQELSGGSVSANILSGGTDENFARTDGSGTRSYLTDALGSTVAMAGASGSVTTSYSYEPFGKASSSGAAEPSTLQFTGRENDGTGLQYNRARYYSPALQRFISQDPLGLGGGDVNTHAYTGNSPTNLVDPTGQFAFLVPMAVGCLSGAAFNVGWDLLSAKLTGSKLNVGSMLGDAAMGCAAGALGGFLGELAGPILGRLFGLGSEAINTGDVAVYRSLNAAGQVQYVGITNNLEARAAAHLAQRGITIDAIPGLRNLSRVDARAVEQVLIERYGLGKNGGTLFNKINSVSESNPIYQQAIARGRQLLNLVGQ
jgi:RHS repeat-associated protein